MTTATVTRYACARCNKKQPAEQMIYSRHTRSRYCLNFKACDRRMNRKNDGPAAPPPQGKRGRPRQERTLT